MAARYNLVQRWILWAVTFAGGALSGAGLLLYGQVQAVRYVRGQVAGMNFLERALGKLTFVWRGSDEKLYLALADVPEEYLVHGERTGLVLGGLGLVAGGVLIPWVLRRSFRR